MYTFYIYIYKYTYNVLVLDNCLLFVTFKFLLYAIVF